jgi:uncharacterized OB-fold protein
MNAQVHPRDAEDPRPVLEQNGDQWVVLGYRCEDCQYCLAASRPRCPVCHGSLTPARFGPGGVVWSGTVLRTPVADRTPPIGLAYVDFDEGPRVLCHFGDDLAGAEPEVPTVGARVELMGLTDLNDPKVRIL